MSAALFRPTVSRAGGARGSDMQPPRRLWRHLSVSEPLAPPFPSHSRAPSMWLRQTGILPGFCFAGDGKPLPE